TDPKTRTAGPTAQGAFTSDGRLDHELLVLVEAPIDALSVATCGLPAAATLGCHLPDWLRWECAFRRASIGTDADAAGEAAAATWEAALRSAGATTTRLRPEGAKDWNEALIADAASLKALMRRHAAPMRPLAARVDSIARRFQNLGTFRGEAADWHRH